VLKLLQVQKAISYHLSYFIYAIILVKKKMA